MANVVNDLTRRGLLARGLPAGAAVWLAACGSTGSQPGQQGAQPREIVWSRQPLGEPRDSYQLAFFRRTEEATGVKIVDLLEPGNTILDKRQAEFAGGTTSVDIQYNQLNWHLPLGLQGLLVDHYELMRRDKVDLKQYYKADIESWAWKGKLYGISSQAGGEVVHFNKALFNAKGVKLPHKDWTYDDMLEAAKKLTDAPNNKFGVLVGQNGLHYMAGTFILNFGGKLLNDTKDKALYGDDANSIRGAELDVDLHTKYRVVPSAEARATLPANVAPMEGGMVAMEFNGLYRHVTVRAAIGEQNLDFAPPPKGPTGLQRVSVAGNAWSIMALSKAKDAAWKALRWVHTKEGFKGPMMDFVAWPPLIWAANSAEWLDRFKGTRIAECAKVWETGGHDIMPLPEGNDAWTTMNTPLNQALAGEVGTREALRESARALNELFSRRPAAWK